MSFDRIIYRLTDKRIPAVTGIGLVGDILDHAEFQKQFRNVKSEDKRSRKQIDCGTILNGLLISEHGARIYVSRERERRYMLAVHSRIFFIRQKMENRRVFVTALFMK